jgi:hypothetical protein
MKISRFLVVLMMIIPWLTFPLLGQRAIIPGMKLLKRFGIVSLVGIKNPTSLIISF